MSGFILAILVALGGGLGATARFLLDSAIPAEMKARFPWGTWLINVSGSFILALVAGSVAVLWWGPAITIGLLGGYTTFSTASLETISLAEDGRWPTAIFYAVGTMLSCLVASLLGLALTT